MLAPRRSSVYIDLMRAPKPQFHPVATAFAAALLSAALAAAPLAAQSPAETPDDMEALFSELAADGEGWMRAQSDIERAWSRSGSAALDLLLMRGESALDAGDPAAAIGHLTALTDHAPDFAAGWAARAAAFQMAGQTGPAMADLARALQLEPRHWPSITLLAAILEDSGDSARALAAYRESLGVNPHQPDAQDGAARLSVTPGQGV